ncbi:MAG TPA: GDSL-type esterase/lipase family protein [Alphaproteobacteria bacterium]|nr:GDSL-type esterase/lipase family protein [Alphaproteobacteria bacterium]
MAIAGFGLAGCGGRGATGIARQDTVLYTALGASDAFGVGAEPISRGYVYRIRDGLDVRLKTVNLINLGIPGAEIDRIAESARTFLQARARPDIVTLWTGANDVIGGRLVADFEPDLGNLLARLRADTDAVVVMANVPDLTRLPRFRARSAPTVTAERVRAFNEAIGRQAARYRVPLVDLFAQPIETELVSDIDGFHPSNEGHRRIAQLFLDTLLPEFGLARVQVAGG